MFQAGGSQIPVRSQTAATPTGIVGCRTPADHSVLHRAGTGTGGNHPLHSPAPLGIDMLVMTDDHGEYMMGRMRVVPQHGVDGGAGPVLYGQSARKYKNICLKATCEHTIAHAHSCRVHSICV